MNESDYRIDRTTGQLDGPELVRIERRLGDLQGVFEQEAMRSTMDPSQVVYRVVAHRPVPEGKEGGLFFGTSFIEPGKVGDEYFMTKGHHHKKLDTAEYYWGIRGEGMLLLMDEDRRWWAERVTPGSLHYIPGKAAHRLANTGDETLAVGACWPSDAGHDYATIAASGFSVRLKSVKGQPALVPVV